MEATFGALMPPILTIIISLIIKEVNLSLFVGIIVGTLLYTRGNRFAMVTMIFDIMSNKVQGLLGMIVHLMKLLHPKNSLIA